MDASKVRHLRVINSIDVPGKFGHSGCGEELVSSNVGHISSQPTARRQLCRIVGPLVLGEHQSEPIMGGYPYNEFEPQNFNDMNAG